MTGNPNITERGLAYVAQYHKVGNSHTLVNGVLYVSACRGGMCMYVGVYVRVCVRYVVDGTISFLHYSLFASSCRPPSQ